MLRRYRKQLITITAVVVFFALFGIILGSAGSKAGSYRKLTIITQVIELIKRNYVEKVDLSRLFSAAFYGMAEGLDPESFYLSKAEYRQYQKDMVMPRAGVGLVVAKRSSNSFPEVLRVISGSSANKAGILPGDLVVSIEGRPTREMTLFQVRNLLSGDEGSEVKLTVRRAGAKGEIELSLIRHHLKKEKGEKRIIEGKVGYFKIPTFTKEGVANFKKWLRELERDGIDYLVIDLRDASGGSLPDMTRAADFLLERGVILSLRSKGQLIASYRAKKGRFFTGKVEVLINSRTKGIPEAFALALAENNRAEVVGEKSFGDGAVRKAIPLSDGSAIILSVAKFVSPKGVSLPGHGVIPSFSIPLPQAKEVGGSPYELQLTKAVEHLIGTSE